MSDQPTEAALPSESAREEQPTESRSCLFGSRRLDFWLLGGLSIVCWAPFYIFQEQLTGADQLTYNISWTAFYLAYFINYPHFMASYKLAYMQGRDFVRDNWFQLVAVPIALVSAVVLCLVCWDSDFAGSNFVASVNNTLAWLGLDTRIGKHKNFGSEALAWMVMFMFLTVGWHYAKQTFGSMMVYARLDNYPLSNLERNLIRYSLLSTWWVTWLSINCSDSSYGYYGLTIHNLALPYAWFQVSYVTVAIMFLLLFIMLVRKYKRYGALPGANFMVPMVALLLWHVPLFYNPQYFYFIALFHSLQYFPFVAKVEKSRYQKTNARNPYGRLVLFFVFMVALGYVCFTLVPGQLDQASDARNTFGFSFFLIAFLAFINIHHYFIDNVLWRFKNQQVRALLFD